MGSFYPCQISLYDSKQYGLPIRKPEDFLLGSSHSASNVQASQSAGERHLNPPSQEEVVGSIARSGDEFYIDAQIADQILLDSQAESTSTLPDTWVTNMTASPLIPQMQTMLR